MPESIGRVLAVDHGRKRIGVAISDAGGALARALTTIHHVSLSDDASRLALIAAEQGATTIVVGQSFDEDGRPNAAGRSAARLGDAVRKLTGLPVLLWDEAFSTKDARRWLLLAGTRRGARVGHQDAQAAAVILQSYLDSRGAPK